MQAGSWGLGGGSWEEKFEATERQWRVWRGAIRVVVSRLSGLASTLAFVVYGRTR